MIFFTINLPRLFEPCLSFPPPLAPSLWYPLPPSLFTSTRLLHWLDPSLSFSSFTNSSPSILTLKIKILGLSLSFAICFAPFYIQWQPLSPPPPLLVLAFYNHGNRGEHVTMTTGEYLGRGASFQLPVEKCGRKRSRRDSGRLRYMQALSPGSWCSRARMFTASVRHTPSVHTDPPGSR